jgi:peptidoglycan/xylan/chitin deacetylase (PgdA/CDA1 family)
MQAMNMTLRRVVRVVLIGSCAAVAAFLINVFIYLAPRYTVPILMYHSISANPDKNSLLSVSASTFEKQMQFLRRHRYNIISLKDLAELTKKKLVIPHNTIVITFDDGYCDNLTVAYPVLKRYKIPATIFVSPFYISNEAKYLTWAELKKLSESQLIDIGSHTLKHVFLLDFKDEAELYAQIRYSKELLERRLGVAIASFSYPAGGFNKKIRQLVIDSGYQAAVATKPGLKYPNNDIFALKRMRISERDSNLFVFWFKLSGYYNPIREWQRHNKDKGIGYD